MELAPQARSGMYGSPESEPRHGVDRIVQSGDGQPTPMAPAALAVRRFTVIRFRGIERRPEIVSPTHRALALNPTAVLVFWSEPESGLG